MARTNAQVAYLAAWTSGEFREEQYNNALAQRATEFFNWLQAQGDTGNAQTALLMAADERGVRDAGYFQDASEVTRRASLLLAQIAAHPAGNSV